MAALVAKIEGRVTVQSLRNSGYWRVGGNFTFKKVTFFVHQNSLQIKISSNKKAKLGQRESFALTKKADWT